MKLVKLSSLKENDSFYLNLEKEFKFFRGKYYPAFRAYECICYGAGWSFHRFISSNKFVFV